MGNPKQPTLEFPRWYIAFSRLKEFDKQVGKLEIPPQIEIVMVKARIVKRPLEADKIENELFQVSEYVTYRPIYEIKFRNIETGEEKAIKIDGVTARIIKNSSENQG